MDGRQVSVSVGPEDEAVARAALAAIVMSKEAALLKKTHPHLAGLLVKPSPASFVTPSFGESAAIDAGIGAAGLPLDRLPTTMLISSASLSNDETALNPQQKRLHKQNQILQGTFTGKK